MSRLGRGTVQAISVLATTDLVIFGYAAAGIAAVASAVTVWATIALGRGTVEQLGGVQRAVKDTVDQLGELQTATRATLREAEQTRRDADRARLRAEYQAIGRLVERVFLGAGGAGNAGQLETDWILYRNELKVVMVGHEDELPRCHRVALSPSKEEALRRAGDARDTEIPEAIRALDRAGTAHGLPAPGAS